MPFQLATSINCTALVSLLGLSLALFEAFWIRLPPEKVGAISDVLRSKRRIQDLPVKNREIRVTASPGPLPPAASPFHL
jgi:hypothetical protein